MKFLEKQNIKAKVKAETTVYNEPRDVGTVLMVDETTFRNLEKKGRLTLAGKDEPLTEDEKESENEKSEKPEKGPKKPKADKGE